MKYSKPSLRTFDSNNEMICLDGSAASSSGCTAGTDIGTWCGVGSGNTACSDGNSAGECGTGSSATWTYTRCLNGTAPS